MEIWEQFSFGRYRGRTIEAVWTGLNPFDDNEVINRYVVDLCSFLLNINNIEEVPASEFDISDRNIEIIFFSQSSISKTVLVSNDSVKIECADRNISIALFKILENILRCSFKTMANYYTKNPTEKSIGHSINSIRFQLLQADPKYIQWCIENVPFFFFDPIELKDLCNKKCRYLTHFTFSKVSEDLFYFKPVFKQSCYPLPISTIEKNFEKFSKNTTGHDDAFYDISPSYNSNVINFCAACHELNCICSDRERSIVIFDF